MSERKDDAADGSAIEDGEEVAAETRAMLLAARQEQPRADLGARVIADVSSRQVHQRPSGISSAPAHPGPRRGVSASRVVTVASILAAAAAAVIALRVTTQPSTMAVAERISQPAARVPAVAASTRALPVDDPCQRRVSASGAQPIIDDFEDGDDSLLPYESRVGLWRWVRDTDRPGTAPALLPIPQRNPSAKDRLALHVKGGVLQDWGATVEFTFQPACYDASVYHGLSMRARGPGRVYLAVREVRLIPPEGGGTCQSSDCYNVHVKKFDLTDKYTTIDARWSELKQRGYHQPPLDPTRIHSIAVMIRPEDTPYDLWIDNVRFIE
jgi:hypothetical protein